eukprot:scaffold24258_cov47-Attheya_sp.AAC.3
MPDGVIVALTAPTFGAYTQHALIVCIVVSAVAIILSSLQQPMTSIRVETAMVLMVAQCWDRGSSCRAHAAWGGLSLCAGKST